MSIEIVRSLLLAHLDEIRGFGVESIGIFGSVARGEAGPDSDVDVIVSFGGPTRFRQYMGLKWFLEGILERPVDLVTERWLKPRARKVVERDLVRVA